MLVHVVGTNYTIVFSLFTNRSSIKYGTMDLSFLNSLHLVASGWSRVPSQHEKARSFIKQKKSVILGRSTSCCLWVVEGALAAREGLVFHKTE